MSTTPGKSKDEIIAVLVAALAVAKGRTEATVRCEFGLDPITAPLSEIGPRPDELDVPTRQPEMLLSA